MDVTGSNILLTKCEFVEDDDGMVTIGSSITIKLIDFGVAELFNVWKSPNDAFRCNKEGINWYLHPSIESLVYSLYCFGHFEYQQHSRSTKRFGRHLKY